MNNSPLYKQEARLRCGGPSQAEFERVLDEAATVRMRKVNSYGEGRYEDESLPHAMTLTYGDIHRKYLRIKEAITGDAAKPLGDGETLREAFLDMANYALMGVQLLDQHLGFPYQDCPTFTEEYLKPSLDNASEHVAEVGGCSSTQENAAAPSLEKIDQIAIYTKVNPSILRDRLKRIFGQELEWHQDTVIARGNIGAGHSPTINQAELSYNYQLCGIEFEILHYSIGNNWHQWKGTDSPAVSHLGIHVENLDEWRSRLLRMGYPIAQQVNTLSHTNPAIKDSRRYSYVIFDTLKDLGFYLKLIKRLPYPDIYPEGDTPEEDE